MSTRMSEDVVGFLISLHCEASRSSSSMIKRCLTRSVQWYV